MLSSINQRDKSRQFKMQSIGNMLVYLIFLSIFRLKKSEKLVITANLQLKELQIVVFKNAERKEALESYTFTFVYADNGEPMIYISDILFSIIIFYIFEFKKLRNF